MKNPLVEHHNHSNSRTIEICRRRNRKPRQQHGSREPVPYDDYVHCQTTYNPQVSCIANRRTAQNATRFVLNVYCVTADHCFSLHAVFPNSPCKQWTEKENGVTGAAKKSVSQNANDFTFTLSDTLGYSLVCYFCVLTSFDVICDLLLNRRTATWNLFVK